MEVNTNSQLNLVSISSMGKEELRVGSIIVFSFRALSRIEPSGLTIVTKGLLLENQTTLLPAL